MTGAPHTSQADQMVAVIRDFICIKPILKSLLPEDLRKLKERLDESFLNNMQQPGCKQKLRQCKELFSESSLGVGSKRGDIYGPFYQVGVILCGSQEPITMGELSELMDVPLSTATRTVDWLVKRGFLDRLSDARDRRIVRIALSKEGRKLYQAIDEFLRQRVEQLLQQFDDAERASLIPLLSKVVKILKQFGE